MSVTYVSPSEPNLTTWIEVKHEDEIIPMPVTFKQGQLVLEDEAEIEAFEALLKHPKCRIGSFVRKLDKEAAEEFARNFQQQRAQAVRGPTTTAAVSSAREGAQMDAIAKMKADGVPDTEIDTISEQLATEESLMVTEDSGIKSETATPAKIPSILFKK